MATGSALLLLLPIIRGFGFSPLSESDSIAVADAVGSGDINLITGPEIFPYVTQADGATWGHGNTIVVAYTDSSGSALNPLSRCGVSVSTDGGVTFRRLPNKFNEVGPCYGEPAVFYSVRSAKWHLNFLSGACGTAGIANWNSSDGINWAFAGCAATANNLDHPTTWVDNHPTSPRYGRQYLLFNDFNIFGGAVRLTFSSDNGFTWSAPASVSPTFLRAVKVTGSLGSDGTIFAQMLDEGGGGLVNMRRNFFGRSTDGGITFSTFQSGAPFLGPGRSVDNLNPHYVGMYTTPVTGYWREMGYGQSGVGPGIVVHQAYSARTAAPADPGNIYYIRSTDTGVTWSAPLKLNSDATTRAQWSPSLAVNAQGFVSVSWYDERNTADDSLQRFARASTDNGVTWDGDMPLSDVIFPKPLQLDPNISATYAGWYPIAAFSDGGYGGEAYHTWTDGRISINGSPQQDLFFDKVTLATTGSLVVTTTDDHNDGVCNASDCTLREAITAANQRLGTDVIVFAPGLSGTIQLNGVLPSLSTDMTLRGPGADVLKVRRNLGGDYRIFTIGDGFFGNGPVVSITGLTLADGQLSGGAFPASCGGGISNEDSTLTLSNCTLSGNHASLHGGAILNLRGALTMESCTVDQNSASASGGAIFTAAYSGVATLALTNCTLSENSAAQYGGTVYNDGAISGNASLTFTNCTLNQNTAALLAGGIYNDALNPSTSGIATLRLRNTILRAGASGANIVNDNGTIISDGHNLSSDSGGFFLTSSGDQIYTDPQLDPAGLANNGGRTRTIAPVAGSPTINAGSGVFAPDLDQRGYLRVGVSDIGAFEFGGEPLRITSIMRLPNGHVLLRGIGVSNGAHSIHASPDLSLDSLGGIGTAIADETGNWDFEDDDAVGLTKHFYRASFP